MTPELVARLKAIEGDVHVGDIWINWRDRGHCDFFVVERVGVIYDSMANVASGYEGTIYSTSGMPRLLNEPIELHYKISKWYFRQEHRKGNWKKVANYTVPVANAVARAWTTT